MRDRSSREQDYRAAGANAIAGSRRNVANPKRYSPPRTGHALVPIPVLVLGFGLYVFFGAGFRKAAGLNPGRAAADGDPPLGVPPESPADQVGGTAVEAEQDT